MRILISGAGIAGPTLAWWLRRYGHEPVIVEQAPAFRAGGYVIDFWGLGYTIAERMGLLAQIERLGYRVREVRVVDRDGRRKVGFSADVFGRMTDDRYVSLPRGALAETIWRAIEHDVPTRFGDEIVALDQRDDGVEVGFRQAPAERFDLVIGADGLHSRVRALAFGPQTDFEHRLGYHVAAADVAGYRPRDEDIYVMYTEPGRQLARFAQRDDRTLLLFVFTDDPTQPEPDGAAAQKAALRHRYAGAGWEVPAALDAVEHDDALYFDRVSQIRMPGWSRGRVALIGDAAFCVSLLAGQGSALAMTAAYVLAGELHRAGGDHAAAFAAYEQRLRPFIEGKQAAAERFAGSFAPRTRSGLWFRDQVMRLLSIRWIADAAIGRDLRDTLELPEYGDAGSAAG